MDGLLLLVVGSGLLGLAVFALRAAWVAGDWTSGIEVSAVIAILGLASIGFGLLLIAAILAVRVRGSDDEIEKVEKVVNA